MASSIAAGNKPARILAGSTILFLMGIAGGCSRGPIPDYVLSDKTKALPELHQKQIREALTLFYGTPTDPRFKGLAPVAAADDAAATASETASTESAASEDTATASDKPAAAPKTGASLKLIDVATTEHLAWGARVYRDRCAGCHGISGDGAGEAAARPASSTSSWWSGASVTPAPGLATAPTFTLRVLVTLVAPPAAT